MSKPTVITLSGMTCSGKSTLEFQLLHTEGFCELVGITTRLPRWGEQPGRDYHFISKEEAVRMIGAGELIESNQFGGHIYGTPKASMTATLATGKIPVIVLEPNGVRAVNDYCQVNGIRHIPVWVDASPASLAERFMHRSQSIEQATIRLALMLSVEQGWRDMMPPGTVQFMTDWWRPGDFPTFIKERCLS